MRKQQLSSIIILLLLLSGCHKRTCPSKDAYNGLYNALTCDYPSRIASLSTSSSTENLKNRQLFLAYQSVIAKVSKQEVELKKLNESIDQTNTLLNEVEQALQNIDTKRETREVLQKIRQQINKMQNNLTIQQPKFSQQLLEHTKRQINKNSLKKDKKVKLAKKFLEKASTQKVKLTDAYQKSYQENQKAQAKIQAKLKESIRLILMGEKSNYLTKESKEKIIAALKETRRYTNSIQ